MVRITVVLPSWTCLVGMIVASVLYAISAML